MKITVEIPVEIVTKKIARNRTNSIFYAGQNIAQVDIGSGKTRTKYILTASGTYDFYTSPVGEYHGRYEFENVNDAVFLLDWLTDAKIEKIEDPSAWGYFEIHHLDGNFDWVKTPDQAYSNYDEAMEKFVEYVRNDLTW